MATVQQIQALHHQFYLYCRQILTIFGSAESPALALYKPTASAIRTSYSSRSSKLKSEIATGQLGSV